MNSITFKWENSSETSTIPIQGVKIQVRDLRIKIESIFNSKKDDIQMLYEKQILNISDEIRNKQMIVLLRIPKSKNICLSCFAQDFEILTPCCQKSICSNCENVFYQKSKCFFNINSQCHYKYTETFQTFVPEPSCNEFITFNSVFYLMRSNKINLAHAKRFSVWTVKEITYLKLAQDCNIPANVILIFINNDEFVGCAKMINQLVVYDQQFPKLKTFKIQWLRRQPSIKTIYDFPPLELYDGFKIKNGIAKAICQSFPIGQIPVEIKQQSTTTEDWDVDEIFRDQEETIKKDEQILTNPIKTSDFSQDQQDIQSKQLNNQNENNTNTNNENFQNIVQIIQTTQELFDKINNGQIPGIKGENKYTHPIVKQLCFNLISNSLLNNNTKNQFKKRKYSRSSSSNSSSSSSSRSSSSSSRDSFVSKSKKSKKFNNRSRKSKKISESKKDKKQQKWTNHKHQSKFYEDKINKQKQIKSSQEEKEKYRTKSKQNTK
ncbi:unnamed protein product [Paramecium sonneborni]|uniref:YTH domain-containing protein n=1 Tax=Paramecium sonneborni TaxID=65129 RepID=A0A8S1R6L5_9CILI|nr:unnamed protein product [Paramecium sonneborni]